jgi:hypothetical protein
MLNDSVSSLNLNSKSQKNKIRALGTVEVRVGPRRAVHGGTAWGARPEDELRQPQDGGVDMDVRSRVAEISAHLNRTNFIEPEDARITGTTRSLMRRLMGLNVIGRMAQKASAAPLRSLMVRKEPQVA